MASDKRIAVWSTVPDGSKIRISVEGTTSKKLVTGHAFLLRGDGMEVTLTDDMLQPGPVEIVLDAPHTYSILLDLVYVTSGTADVTAELLSGKKRIPPDGSTDKEFTSTVAGTEGQTLGLTFFIITE